MCLHVNKKATAKVRQLFAEHDGVLTVYKILRHEQDAYYSPYHGMTTKWTTGWRESDRESVELSAEEKESGNIRSGIHVCWTEDEARNLVICVQHGCIVKVQVHAEDFIAADESDGVSNRYDDAVFKRVFVPEDAFMPEQFTSDPEEDDIDEDEEDVDEDDIDDLAV